MEKDGEDLEKERRKAELGYTPVKSTAVVKYASASVPAKYTKLQCNTDLNLPPSNWLSNSTELYGIHPSLHCRSGFSSFRMAHMFPDCVGVVDIVSDAENVKKLLKMAYSNSPVSLMIHRVENTLLIDEFDVHKYLMREAENQWEWFRKFFLEHFKKSLDVKRICHKDNSRNALKQKSLISKFLYHSLVVSDQVRPTISEQEDQEVSKADPSVAIPLPYGEGTKPVLPEPTLEQELPDPGSNHKFTRNVIWTFEDLQMLLGTDMPIFGGGTHPCISLRLRDMAKPINVLTGMDYWLDNLMCNVPEVVMCYHLNGIVQKYELIKTEDLPHLENSKFSPKVIRDIAQNILSFLKSNATKAGHTYWLFKGKNDDVVKLYDLTSLCTDVLEERGQTPFTVPVAMLLYRVARNMKHSDDSRCQVTTIRMLLENCLALLPQEQYPQIVTSAHYMLADLYLPSDINPSSPELVDEDETQSDYNDTDKESEINDEEEDLIAFNESSCIKTLSLSSLETFKPAKTTSVPQPPPPMKSDVEGRCKDSLKHVLAGLNCLQFFEKESKSNKTEEEEEPRMAKPFNSIPMPYKTTEDDSSGKQKKNKSRRKKKKSVSDVDTTNKLLCTETKPIQQELPQSWSEHLKCLLYEKACLIFITLSERFYTQQKYGLTLHYIKLILKCRAVMLKISEQKCDLEAYVLGRAGDAFFMLVQNITDLDSHNKDYVTETDEEKVILSEINKENCDVKLINVFLSDLKGLESLLLASCLCYKEAIKLDQVKESLFRRLGNIQNEIGVFYMNQAASAWQNGQDADFKSQFKILFNKSFTYFEGGVKSFENVKDSSNLALLHSNTGRLMRLRAHVEQDKPGQEQYFYNKAIACYQKAIQVLGERKHCPVIWDTVNWELSSALFTIAKRMQDYPDENKSLEEAERDIVDMFLKCLKYCDADNPGPRQLVYQYRCGLVHHRLGSLYHKIFRCTVDDDNKRKTVLHLSKLHYKKSSEMFLQLENCVEFMSVQMERIALSEYQTSFVSGQVGKLKSLEVTLKLLLECKQMFSIIGESCYSTNKRKKNKKDGEVEDKTTNEEMDEEELIKLLKLYESRLQHTLLELNKISLVKGKKEGDAVNKNYKKMYSIVLKSSEDKFDDVSITGRRLFRVLSDIENVSY